MPPSESIKGPSASYEARLASLEERNKQLKHADSLFVAFKVGTGVVLLALAIWLAKYHAAQIAYLAIPFLLLVVLFVAHERVLTQLRDNERLREFYEQGIARLEDRWAVRAALAGRAGREGNVDANNGEEFLDVHHPYARDLDLFGHGSLYHLLCTVRTRVGRETLAAWLLEGATLPEAVERQAAVRELAPLLDVKETLVLAGEKLEEKARQSGRQPESLAAWSEQTEGLDRRLHWPALIFAVLWIVSVLGWQIAGGRFWIAAAMLMTIAVRLFGARYRSATRESVAQIQGASEDLAVLAGVLRAMEQQPFRSPKLLSLQTQLGLLPSQALSSLTRRIDWLASADNWFVKILDGFIFWRLQAVLWIEDWRRLHGSAVRSWLAGIGTFEALTAFSTYAYEHPDHTYPTFVEDGPLFEAEEMAHPLLSRAHAVSNDLRLDRELQLLVISGPNMAGKSTFIRSVGVNAVLALAGAPVRARVLRMSALTVAASISIQDSLQGGLSRFYAEILRLKDIDALSRRETPVLFLLDELLSGTNSHDRRIGTEALVRSLVGRLAIGLVTTHDLALAEMADHLGGRAANGHFQDRYEGGKLHFEYKLRPGVVQSSNALELMRSIGLEV